MQLANYHTHTNFSDGSDFPEIYIKKAIALGHHSIGISDHAPIPYYPQKWNMPMEQLHQYLDHINNLKSLFEDQIKVLTSLEIDYIPDLVNPLIDFIPKNSLDYTIGSIHYLGKLKKGELFGFELLGSQLPKGLHEVFNDNVVKMVEAYYGNLREMIQYFTPDIVGHLDRIKIINRHQHYFDEQENWYQDELKETMHVLAQTKAVMEINTKSIYGLKEQDPYPSYWVIALAKKYNIPIVLSSDAHQPQFIDSGFKEVEAVLSELNYSNIAVF